MPSYVSSSRRAQFAPVAIVMLTFAAMSIAADEPWKLSLDANLTMTFNAYSDDWAGGESGSLSWASRLEAVAAKQVGKYLHTKNTLKLAFGQTKTQRKDDSWTAPEKSTDLIDFETRWKSPLGGWVDPYISVRCVSQFIDLSDTTTNPYYPYGNPIDITESAGALRELVAKEELSSTLRLGGALQQNIDRWAPYLKDTTVIRDGNRTDTTIASSNGGKDTIVVTNSGGIEAVVDFEAVLRDGFLKYKTSLKVYEALFRADSDKLPNHWRYPDVNWENTLTATIAKYVMISYQLQLLYDKEINANARIKQTLAIGLTYGGKYPKPQEKKKDSGS
ncbi:MAG: DUF3078 domain-containing protein [Chitinivibrionales bacterium]|nr:DUF3078 domain-containing protein [Chitinivibrionales bacterium]